GRIIYYGTSAAQFIIKGGTIDIKQFQSVAGGGKTAFWQEEGKLVLRGRFRRSLQYSDLANLISSIGNPSYINTVRAQGTDANVGTLNLDQDANIFHLEGGSIDILDPSGSTGTPRALEINSEPENISVTGGIININITSGTGLADASYGIASKAPFYNLKITRSSGIQSARQLTIPSKTGVTGLAAPPLRVLGNLTLSNTSASSNPVLNSAGFNLIVGGNVEIQSNTVYDPGNNRTVLDGSSSQLFKNEGVITNGLYRFVIDKNSGTAALGSNLVVRDSLVINKGTLDDGGFTLQLSGHLYNGGVHTGSGKIQLAGTSVQNLSASQDGSSSYGNLDVSNFSGASGSIVAQLASNISVHSLSLTSERVLYIGSYTLTVGVGGIAPGLSYGLTRMIRTNGLSSDGGVKRYIDNSYNSQTVLYPLGCAGGPKNTAIAYFPARVVVGSISTPGYFTVVPVSGYHPSCDVTKTNEALDFYWKTKKSGLVVTGTNHLEFDYRTNIGNSYNDTYYLLAGSSTWVKGASANNSPTVSLPVSIGLAVGEFTTGKSSPYSDPRTYYSRQSGAWNASSGGAYTTWSFASHTGAAVPSTFSLPRNFDNVVIGGVPGVRNDSVAITTNSVTAAIITIKASYTGDNSSPVLNIGSTTGHSIDIIRGGGKLCVSTSTIPSSPTDYGDLLANDTATINFYGGSYILPAALNGYPNLLITGNATKYLPGSVTVRKNLIIADEDNANNALSLNSTSGNLTVYGNLSLRNGGKLLIPASASARDINVYGDIDFTYGGTSNSNSIQTVSGAGSVNRLNFYGKRILAGASSLILNPANTNKTDLFIKGQGNVTVSKGSTSFDLNRLFIQKNQLSDTVHFINNFTLNEGANSSASKSLTLSTGTLILSDPSTGSASSIDLNLSSGGTSYFLINSSSRLILRNGSVVRITGNTYGSGLRLDGLLAAEGASGILFADGTTANTGYIEYTGSGNASIILSGSSIFRAAQVRRSLSLTTGILKYSQSGTSSAIFYGTGDAGFVSPDRAKLEIAGTGSSFNMSGTSSILITKGGGTSFGDLFLRPGNSDVTGGSIVFGTGAAGQIFKMDANVPLYNITVNTTGAASELQLMVNPLVLRGSLTINPNTQFTANNINVTIAGDLVNNGTITTGSSTTLFNGATQQISGADPLFWNLTVNPSVKLKIACDITVRGSLNIISGILETTDYSITAKGNILNNGTYTNNPSGTSRFYINGSALQHIAGAGSFGRIEIDNTVGVKLDNDLNLTESLKLSNGVLDINQFGLTLGPNSLITGGTPGPGRMIISDGVFSNQGIKKYFSAGYSGTFIFPSGVNGKYTPAILNVTATGAGFVRMNIINSRHPATLSPYNVLKYYWEAESSVTGFEGNITFSYSASDVTGDESQYVAGRLIIPPGTGWSKAAAGSLTDNVNESDHSMFFNFPAGTSNLGGQYTAGFTSDLPNTIPVYTSNTVLGNWDNPASWSPVAPAGGPNGFSVVIREGDTIRTNGNRRFSFKTTINGKLDVGTSYGHNLGTVDGTGTLALQQANLPAGNFHNFLGCSGGTLEYGGSGTYTIVADRIDTVRNLAFRGTGTRILPDKNLVICNRLLIKGPVLNNQFNRKLSVGGSFDLESGSFVSGSGNEATVAFNGTLPQTISGFRTANPLNNLEINNAAGLTLNSAIMVKGNLILTKGMINTTADSLLKMTGQSGTVTGGSSDSFVNGPMSKNQLGGIDFTFPVGKPGRYGKIDIVNPQTGVWEAEYYNNPYTDLTVAGTLIKASLTEYWRIKSPADGKTTAVRLRWDYRSDVNPATTAGGISDLRVAEYDGADWREKSSANQSGNDTDGTVQTASNITVSNTAHPKYYTLGSSSPVKPTIITGAVTPVFRCTTTGYLPYSSVTGSPDQYMIDFDNAANSAGLSDVAWTLLPVSP
ncbi:MAG TPA: hypothetical protein VHO68_02280, partial [Bacteroidales bacterium]|nr:hypothetical protein [Bacteroidales bacterium]